MTTQTSPAPFARSRALLLLLLAVTIVLGAVEGVYGRVRYSGDAINYLNIVRAIHVGDWKLALNSYWGLGYPLLISIVTPLFPTTPSGEWVAVHVLNVLILAATFGAFYWLTGTAAQALSLHTKLTPARRMVLILGAFAIFLSTELAMDNVSRVGPDMLVSGIVFAAAALLLRLKEQPTAKRAVALGALLGLGFIVKAIFLPLTLVFAFTALVAMWKRRPRFRYLLLILVTAAVFEVPYVAGLSWAAGRFTYGDAGPLNYAWNVNKLEPGGLWQGQPPTFGTPVHPAKLVSVVPHIYLFDGPFAVTFAPFFDPPYYYQGYRRVFSLKAQIHAFGGNLLRLVKVLHRQFVIYALVLCWAAGRPGSKTVPRRPSALATFWPLLLVALGATAIYLLVFVEARYVASFLAMTLLVALLSMVGREAIRQEDSVASQRRLVTISLLLAGCLATLLANAHDSDRDLIGHIRHHQVYSNDDQWKAGQYLRQAGLHPGDKVAIAANLVDATRSTWAYMDEFQIVGILGGSLLETQTMDFDAFWHATPDAQRAMLENFHHTGARAVVAMAKPADLQAEGWTAIPGTPYWLYRF